MKKLWKPLLAAAGMSLLMGVCAGMSVSAATYSGDLTGYDGEVYSWTVDTNEETLTLYGHGLATLGTSGELPWARYADHIETIVADAGINPNGHLGMFDTKTFPHLKTVIGEGNGTMWSYDIASETLTLSGEGRWSVQSYPFGITFDYQKLVIADGITGCDLDIPQNIAEVVLGKDVKLDSAGQVARADKITADAQNPYYSSYQGCLYTKGYQELLVCPRYSTSVTLHPDVKIIGEDSLPDSLTGTLVLPWGVTAVERDVFHDFQNRMTVVIPDTVTEFDIAYNNSNKVIFMIAKNNPLFNTLVKTGTEIWTTGDIGQYYPEGTPEVPDEPEQPQSPGQAGKNGWEQRGTDWYYYINGQRATGWQKISGIWYYLDSNGLMQTGWRTDNGSTYLLRDWGGMMENGWYLVGGRWYYFNSWGGMVKNSWIYGLDKKWYYVGTDGAMLVNTRTPDGYWVNGDGVWIP